jgi:hypothetical protein
MTRAATAAPPPRQYPFPWHDPRPMNDRMRDANYEADRAAWNKESPVAESYKGKNASALRGMVLEAIAPVRDGFYDPEAQALLSAFEAALRLAWEDGERGFIRQRAEEAVRRALEAIGEGKLL